MNQQNPGFLQESPEQDSGRNTPARITRSPSGHQSVQSVGTNRSDATYMPSELLGKDDAEVRIYLHKTVEIADAENKEFYVDKMEPFNEEGSYEPLGSIGSLYDFVKELDEVSSPKQPLPKRVNTTSVAGLTRQPSPELTAEKHGDLTTPPSIKQQPTPTKSQSPTGHGKRPITQLPSPKVAAEQHRDSPSGHGKRPVTLEKHGDLSLPPSSRQQPCPTKPQSPTAHGKRPLIVMPAASLHTNASPTKSLHSHSPEKASPPPTKPSLHSAASNVAQNGLWMPVNKNHSRSASQPDVEMGDLGVSSKDPTRLRRSGRRSHRINRETDPAGSILEKFHQVTTNAGHRNGIRDETVVL